MKIPYYEGVNKTLLYGILFLSVALCAGLISASFFNSTESHTRLTVGVLPLPADKKIAETAEASSSKVVNAVEEETAPEPEPEPAVFQYIKIVDSCDSHFEGACVNMRSGPGAQFPAVLKLRTGIVLKVAETVEQDKEKWYKIKLDPTVRYPERISSSWYVSAEFATLFNDKGDEDMSKDTPASTTKRIIVDRSKQMLYAYDGDDLFMEQKISSGLDGTPTPRGMFKIYRKTPSRYMQGPVPGVSDQYFDLPGVPWDLYFTYEGGAIHGAYWHENFGQQWSHGCVNLPPEQAQQLYAWADVGTPVLVRD